MKVLYFAWLRQRVGTHQEEFARPANVRTVGDLMTYIGQRYPGFAEAANTQGAVRAAVNQDHVDRDHPVNDNDEVAFFPPVTGG